MKKTYILIAVAIVAALSMAGCKNNNKKSQEPTQEEIQAQKQALADSVLVKVDAFAEMYIDAKSKFHISEFELTETEKMVKPDYLLDPFEASKFVTKSQKVNALAIYVVERLVRKMYDMPIDETNEAIARLVADINYPYDYDLQHTQGLSVSQRMKAEYDKCKENGDLFYFWKFHNAVIFELGYLFAYDPELFFSRINEEKWEYYNREVAAVISASAELAKYDDELATLNEIMLHNSVYVGMSKEEIRKVNATIESAKQFRFANKDKYAASRNALLK